MSPNDTRPNFLVIVADDLGFTDPGCFGGEIHTPNIDALGNTGVRFSDFQASPACSPSRSMIMTGTSAHLSGLGTIPEFHVGRYSIPEYKDQPAYLGHLSDRVVTMPELLRDAGYYNVMAGKWHLGATKAHSPKARGFEKSFTFLLGGGNHHGWEPTLKPEDYKYKPMIRGGRDGLYLDEDEWTTNLPEGYYSSDYFADRLVSYLKDRKADDERPFFAYLPFQAPHFPLQVSKEYIQKYHGRYDAGPERIREERIERLRNLGFIPRDAKPAVFQTYPKRMSNRDWEQRDDLARKRSARKMEVFAGMVERMDYNIGKVLEYLESTGQRDNTVIFFLSDNGAEGTQLEAAPANRNVIPGLVKYFDNSLENLGAPNSFCWYGNRWAQVGTAPSKLYKFFTHQGGIRVCSLVSYPKWKRNGIVSHQYCTVMDILPTVLELAGVQHPGQEYKGKPIEGILGKSWNRYMMAEAENIHDDDTITGWEFIGRQALRKGSWKIVRLPPPWGTGQWELYDLSSDLAEAVDLREEKPEKLVEMLRHWKEYAERNGIVDIKTVEQAYAYQEEEWTESDLEDVV
ncbi:related to Arylsulfatase [Cephalotrichum gorgonifer]|uniref:Related to Arylsulfatase n=1 Tax=Cephalotrichum gorgonifer TaxID=2041049 RepID=A0AAE8N7D9_9PEZI|nr:related to Arylsulfatase [Cephalotrichum gorgonifer]